MSFLTFGDRGTSPSGKTRRLVVQNKVGAQLGYIHWVTGWRRYCFFPVGEPYFDAGCLGEIMAKLQELMKERE
jgi:hypothetical protein